MTTEKNQIPENDHIDEHDYDGIQELDNPAPRWIMAIFYITIGFSILYGAYYFWLGVGDHQVVKYTKKSELHDAKYNIVNMSSDDLVMLTDEAALEEGKTIYSEMACAACHGNNGEGNAIGPNITDEYSINGCDFKSTFDIIKHGNPAKGMTPFNTQLSDEKIQKVASYVMSLVGSNPANAKEPQGEKCE